MTKVEVDEAKEHLSDLIDEALQGIEVVLTKDKKPVVKLVPVSDQEARPVFGSARGLIWLSPDFDEPLEDFVQYQ